MWRLALGQHASRDLFIAIKSTVNEQTISLLTLSHWSNSLLINWMICHAPKSMKLH